MKPGHNDVLGIVATTGLKNRLTDRAPVSLDDAEFSALCRAAAEQRISSHLVAAVDAGIVCGSERQRAEARWRHEQALALDLVLERKLAETSSAFTAAGITHRALKGPVVARTVYVDPAQRSFGDVDILVAPTQFDAALELLTTLGGKARYEQPRNGFTSRFGKGVCVVAADGLELDVHRVFASGPFGLAMIPNDLFEDTSSIVLAGTEIPTLGLERNFLHVCYHAALGDRLTRYTTLRDIAEFLSLPTLDAERVLSLATRWRGRAVVQRALHRTRGSLPVMLRGALIEWADEYRPDTFERAALETYTATGARYDAQAAAGLAAIRGIRQKVAYAGALLFPSRSYLRQRERSYTRRWLRALHLQRRWGQVR
jgi:hypothetical protein